MKVLNAATEYGRSNQELKPAGDTANGEAAPHSNSP